MHVKRQIEAPSIAPSIDHIQTINLTSFMNISKCRFQKSASHTSQRAHTTDGCNIVVVVVVVGKIVHN